MTIGETVRKAIKEISESVLGLMMPKDIRLTDDECCKPKRARTKKGKYKADDKSTPDVNEAYVGGKAPKKTRKKTTRKKK
tara:strand:- start:416 stop:655 length:240 start_codon:yes stop_codon:yes gene_type:complete